jgi:hypothetical protein
LAAALLKRIRTYRVQPGLCTKGMHRVNVMR